LCSLFAITSVAANSGRRFGAWSGIPIRGAPAPQGTQEALAPHAGGIGPPARRLAVFRHRIGFQFDRFCQVRVRTYSEVFAGKKSFLRSVSSACAANEPIAGSCGSFGQARLGRLCRLGLFGSWIRSLPLAPRR
jgi:hypothetical protein